MKKIFALLLAMAMMLSLLAACGGNGETTSPDLGNQTGNQTSAPGGNSEPAPGERDTTVVVGMTGAHDPCMPSNNSNDFLQQAMVYDKIFEVDDHTGEYTSRTMESWEWTDDVTFVMTLKEGMTFSDGNPVTGEDVLFSIQDYVTNEAAPSTDKYMYYINIDFDASSVSEDGRTVTLVWKAPYGPAYRQLNCAIVEKAFVEAHDNSDTIWYTGPVGSGPYEITDCVIDSYVTFTLREDYWNKDYSYDATQITLRYYSDGTAMYADYQNGLLDAMYNVSSIIAEQVEAAGGKQGTVQYISSKDNALLCLNDNNPYLADPAVREAIAYALDMDAIAGIAYGVLCQPAKSHFGVDFPFYTPHETYTYDVARAKQILADAGYKEGEIQLLFNAPQSAPKPAIAEAVQGYLREVGIIVEVNVYDLPTALTSYVEGVSDMACLSVRNGNGTMEPYQVMSSIEDGAAFASTAIDDAEFNRMVDLGLNSVDESVSNDAYAQADAWLWENYHALPVCEYTNAVVYNSRISSFDQSTVGKGCMGALTLS